MKKISLVILAFFFAITLTEAKPILSPRSDLEVRYITYPAIHILITDRDSGRKVTLDLNDSNMVSRFRLDEGFDFGVSFGRALGLDKRKAIFFTKKTNQKNEIMDVILLNEASSIEFASKEDFPLVVEKIEIQNALNMTVEESVHKTTE